VAFPGVVFPQQQAFRWNELPPQRGHVPFEVRSESELGSSDIALTIDNFHELDEIADHFVTASCANEEHGFWHGCTSFPKRPRFRLKSQRDL
jgi:hypothetical protein